MSEASTAPDRPMDEVTRPVWHRRLHWRLLRLYGLLVIPALLALFIFINHNIQEQLQQRTQRQLAHDAELLARVLSQTDAVSAADDEGGWDRLADLLAQNRPMDEASGLRVTLIDEGGRVLGDSELSAAALVSLESHDSRPEVRAALNSAEGVGYAMRDSDTLRQPLIYAARRLPEGSAGRLRVVRVACSQAAYEALLRQARTLLALAALVVALLLGLSSYLTSRMVSRPMAAISQAARRLATQARPVPLAVDHEGELATLVESINALSAHLNRRLAQIEADKVVLAAILNGMTEGVVVCDTDGRLVMVNPAARRLLGVGEGEVEGRLLLEVFRSPELTDALDEVTQLAEPIARELVVRRNETQHLMLAAAPLTYPEATSRGQRPRVVAVLHDITRLRKLERIRRDFVANVSHELRTPLATITGYAETLLGGAVSLDPVAQEFVGTIERHVKRLNTMVADLLMLARIEADGQRPTLSAVSLSPIQSEALEAVEVLASERGVTLHKAQREAPPVLAEPRALTQVLRNLLENAVRYSEPDGEVRLVTELDEQRIRIHVIDRGVGIEPRHLSRIFERFYRVDEGRSRDEGGSGLGLAIVKHMVQSMGGEISAVSTPGEGSTFTVTLDVAPPSRSRTGEPSDAAQRARSRGVVEPDDGVEVMR